jgi:hypothetical protein
VPQSAKLQITNYRPRNESDRRRITFRDFSIEGTYTLSLATIRDPYYTLNQFAQNSCVRYVYREGAPSACPVGGFNVIPQAPQENNKKLLFMVKGSRGGTQYVFAFSGLNLDGQCFNFAVVVTAGSGYDLCTGVRTSIQDWPPGAVDATAAVFSGTQPTFNPIAWFDVTHV